MYSGHEAWNLLDLCITGQLTRSLLLALCTLLLNSPSCPSPGVVREQWNPTSLPGVEVDDALEGWAAHVASDEIV